MAKNGLSVRSNLQAGDVCQYNYYPYIGIPSMSIYNNFISGCYYQCYNDNDTLKIVPKTSEKISNSFCP